MQPKQETAYLVMAFDVSKKFRSIVRHLHVGRVRIPSRLVVYHNDTGTSTFELRCHREQLGQPANFGPIRLIRPGAVGSRAQPVNRKDTVQSFD